LRLDERDTIGCVFEAIAHSRKYLDQRDERHVNHCQVETNLKLLRVETARVHAFERLDARVLPYPPRELIVTYINCPDERGSVLQQAIGEAAGRSAYVNTRFAFGADVEFSERLFQLETSATDIAQ